MMNTVIAVVPDGALHLNLILILSDIFYGGLSNVTRLLGICNKETDHRISFY